MKWELVWVNQSGTHLVGNERRLKLNILNDWLCRTDGHVITSLDGIDLKIKLLRLHWRLFSYFQNTIFSMFSINWLTFEFSSNDSDANHLLENIFFPFVHLISIALKSKQFFKSVFAHCSIWLCIQNHFLIVEINEKKNLHYCIYVHDFLNLFMCCASIP